MLAQIGANGEKPSARKRKEIESKRSAGKRASAWWEARGLEFILQDLKANEAIVLGWEWNESPYIIYLRYNEDPSKISVSKIFFLSFSSICLFRFNI